MPDKSKKFHEFALKSGLFKGRYDWYFCYVKTERIVHVLAILASRGDAVVLKDIITQAQSLPGDIARMTAGEFDISAILAELFALLSAIRVAGTRGLIHHDNCVVICREYEQVAERIVAGSNPSPFGSAEDFMAQELPPEPLSLAAKNSEPLPHAPIKDTALNKGHKGQTERSSLIIDYIRKHKNVSIKDIAAIIRDCSEKTVQRELNDLIRQGLVRRIGSRRWSTYELA